MRPYTVFPELLMRVCSDSFGHIDEGKLVNPCRLQLCAFERVCACACGNSLFGSTGM